MPLYFSTSCLSNRFSLEDKLEIFNRLSIEYVELGYSNDSTFDFSSLLSEYKMNFIAHNYFPPPSEDFVINLSSSNPKILLQSINQIKRSIEFCSDCDINFFSFHSGFRVDPDLKFNFPRDNSIEPYEDAFNRFIFSLEEINTLAIEKKVQISIENNVLAPYNLIGNKNELLLMCEEWEFKRLFEQLTSKFEDLLEQMEQKRQITYWPIPKEDCACQKM